MELKINTTYRDLLDPIPVEAHEALEHSIIKDGLLNPIITWNGTIIDGHNRYEICRKLDIEFDTIEMSFKDSDDAKLWILRNQMARRNMTDYSRVLKALKMKPILEEKARERQRAGVPSDSAEGGEVRDQIAKLAGVGRDTIAKVEEIDAAATDEIKAKVQSGEMSINAAHKALKVPADRLKVNETLDIPIPRKSIRMLKNAVDDICDSWGDLSDQELMEVQSNTDRLNDQIERAHDAAQPALDAPESAISY